MMYDNEEGGLNGFAKSYPCTLAEEKTNMAAGALGLRIILLLIDSNNTFQIPFLQSCTRRRMPRKSPTSCGRRPAGS